MGERPPNTTLDRIDNNGDYCPENCRWANIYQQSNNRRNNIRVEYDDELLTLGEWSRKIGIGYKVLLHRYHKGDRGERLFRKVGS
jgi:hypothetical protein